MMTKNDYSNLSATQSKGLYKKYGERNKYFGELNFYNHACEYSLYYTIINVWNVYLKKLSKNQSLGILECTFHLEKMIIFIFWSYINVNIFINNIYKIYTIE